MTAAIILHAPLRLPLSCPAWQEPLLQALPYGRRLELERRDAGTRRASLAGLGLVLLASSRLTGRALPPRSFSFPPDGKPRLAAGPYFSISHSSACVACVVCADIDCGIDIEDVPESADPGSVTRVQRWTATEAALKAAGLGVRAMGQVALATSLATARVGMEHYELRSLQDVPGVVGHVAASQVLTPIVERLDLDDGPWSALLERSFGLAAQIG
jgi:hypothetical protein